MSIKKTILLFILAVNLQSCQGDTPPQTGDLEVTISRMVDEALGQDTYKPEAGAKMLLFSASDTLRSFEFNTAYTEGFAREIIKGKESINYDQISSASGLFPIFVKRLNPDGIYDNRDFFLKIDNGNVYFSSNGKKEFGEKGDLRVNHGPVGGFFAEASDREGTFSLLSVIPNDGKTKKPNSSIKDGIWEIKLDDDVKEEKLPVKYDFIAESGYDGKVKITGIPSGRYFASIVTDNDFGWTSKYIVIEPNKLNVLVKNFKERTGEDEW